MYRITIPALTAADQTANLYPHSQKTSVGIETPVTTGPKAASVEKDNAVFYCPSKIISTALVRLKSAMVGCIGQPQGWPVPVAGSLNPVQPASQRLRPKGGGYIPTTGETAMRHHTQNPPIIHRAFNPRFDLFKWHGGVKTLVCRGINLEQARGLLPESSAYRLKFTGMVKGGAA